MSAVATGIGYYVIGLIVVALLAQFVLRRMGVK
jgi:hypothetical protein